MNYRRLRIVRSAVCLFVGFLATQASPVRVFADDKDQAALVARSLVSEGDASRLQHVLAKARRGEPVTVGVIGGSITAGALASTPEKRYGNLVAQWWRQTFPKTKINFVNAGIGATRSDYGALRAQQDLLVHKPDFVVIEYGVNDGYDQAYAATLEGLVRQVLNQPNRPAVMLLFMMDRAGGNAQEWHGKIGKHYALPMVSVRDALWPAIQAKQLKWEDVVGDMIHPNDRGHAYSADFVVNLLEKVFKELPADAALPQVGAMPKPLFDDQFEHVELLEADALKPVKNKGWTLDAKTNPLGKNWVSKTPGSRIEFTFEGRTLLVMDWHLRGPMGKAKVQVDDQTPVILDAWFDQTWGGYRLTQQVANNLAPGKHRVTFELLAEKNPQSSGHEYRIFGLGIAGTPER